MDVTQLTDELKKYYKSTKLPEPKAVQPIMDRIYSRKQSPNSTFRDKRLVAVSMLAIFLICSGFTFGKWIWETRNSKGEVTLRMHPFGNGMIAERKDMPENISGKMVEIYEGLETGEGAVVYFKGDECLNVTIKPITYSDIILAKSKVQFDFKTPTFLPSGYTLSEVEIHFSDSNQYKMEDLIKEAEQTGKEIVIKKFNTPDKGDIVDINYRNSNGKELLTLTITQHTDTGLEIFSDRRYEKVMVGGDEALLSEQKGVLTMVLSEVNANETNTKTYTQYHVISWNIMQSLQ